MEPISGGLKVAIYIITLIFVYFIAATVKSEHIDADIAKNTSTYLQSILMLIAGYYWGNSSKQKLIKDSEADEYAKAVVISLEEKRLEAAKQEAERLEKERLEKAEETAEKVIQEAQNATS